MPMKAQRSASSSDEFAIFEAYVGLINSEHETLWARHNALLLANSLIIGALAISPAALWETMGGTCHAECRAPRQRRMARDRDRGWSAMQRHVEIAGNFASRHFEHLPDPFAEST